MFRKRQSSDFSSEIEAHIRLEADRYRERGMSEDEALAAARRAFGNTTSSQERFYESQRWAWWEHLRQDVRLAVRVLKNTPGWTAVAVLTAALGIGATTAIFSVVNAVLLRPLPFPHPEQLYSVVEFMGRPKSEMALGGDYFTMRDNLHRASTKNGAEGGIVDMAAYDTGNASWTGADGAEQLTAGLVTASLFSVLEAKPLLGRTFLPDEDRPGADPAVLLSYRFWRNRYAGDPEIVGKTIRLDRAPATVIGVMPRSFDFPQGTDVWFPLAMDEAAERERKGMSIISILARAHLPAERTALPRVNAELEHLTSIVLKEYPVQMHGQGFIEGMRIFARPLQESLTGEIRPALRVFSGAVGLMLLIVCFNVANLMLTRATARRREIAVRVALGAPRRRIVGQLLTESLVVSLLGGGLGLALAAAALGWLNSSHQAILSGLPEISIGIPAAGFALAVTLLTGILFGLAPSLGALGFRIGDALKSESRTSTGGAGLRRTGHALVISQLGLSLTLLIGAGLLAKSFLQLRNANPGFEPRNVLTARIHLTGQNYETIQRQTAFFENLLDKLARVPAVAAAAVAPLPIGDSGNFTMAVHIEGRPPRPRGQGPPIGFLAVSPQYFKTLAIPLRQGRLLEPRDSRNGPPVTVVNEAFVKRFLPGENPLGRRISLSPPGEEEMWEEIVGVVGDIHQGGLDRDAGPALYHSIRQEQRPVLRGASLLVRTTNDPLSLTPILRQMAASVDPDEAVFDVKTLEDRLADSLGSRRFDAALVGCFALMAAILAAIGVYGVMSYQVALRTSEIGIRIALGARSAQVLRLILGEGMWLGLVGGVLGTAGALGLGRFVAALLYGVDARDPLTFCAAAVVLFGAVLAASLVPGRRAAHVDPAVTLRHE